MFRLGQGARDVSDDRIQSLRADAHCPGEVLCSGEQEIVIGGSWRRGISGKSRQIVTAMAVSVISGR